MAGHCQWEACSDVGCPSALSAHAEIAETAHQDVLFDAPASSSTFSSGACSSESSEPVNLTHLNTPEAETVLANPIPMNLVDVDVESIFFTQSSVKPHFEMGKPSPPPPSATATDLQSRDHGPGHAVSHADAADALIQPDATVVTDALSLETAIHQLNSGVSCVADYPPIRITRYLDTWYTLDNRRLYVFKQFSRSQRARDTVLPVIIKALVVNASEVFLQ